MKQVRVVIEYTGDSTGAGGESMRWERQCTARDGTVFELLGRAFELAQREEEMGLPDAVAAFCKGAMVTKEDIVEAMGTANSGENG